MLDGVSVKPYFHFYKHVIVFLYVKFSSFNKNFQKILGYIVHLMATTKGDM